MVDLTKAAMWPMIALLIIILFYGPIRHTLESLAQRSDEIQTIKLGSLELDIRARDLPSPKLEVANALKASDTGVITELFSNLRGGGQCYSPDENSDTRFPHDSKLAQLGLITLTRDEKPASFCPHSYSVSITPLGRDSADFLLLLIEAQIKGKKSN
jgi:hypothetical protein